MIIVQMPSRPLFSGVQSDAPCLRFPYIVLTYNVNAEPSESSILRLWYMKMSLVFLCVRLFMKITGEFFSVCQCM